MEIGSEFWINSIIEEQCEEAGWLSKYGNFILTSSGRDAFSLLLKEVKPKVPTALLPAYICSSVISPFLQKGYHCSYYDVGPGLEPIIDTMKQVGEIGVFVHMGYYGFPTNHNLSCIVKELKRKDTIIVEDITHSLFSEYSRFDENDFYVASIRKWMGIPSGGLLASPARKLEFPLSKEDSFSIVRREALRMKAEYMKNSNPSLKKNILKLFAEGEDILSRKEEPTAIDSLSKSLLYGADRNEIIQRRRDNFATLAEGLKANQILRPVIWELPDMVCPMFYPVYLDRNREVIRQKLTQQEVYCPIHWPLPEQIDLKRYSKAAEIYRTVLSIPCDQRYGAEDMERVCEELRKIVVDI